jgi:hypothetical protein
MSEYLKRKKFTEQFDVKNAIDLKIEGDEATLYTEEGKEFFDWNGNEWVYVGSKEW